MGLVKIKSFCIANKTKQNHKQNKKIFMDWDKIFVVQSKSYIWLFATPWTVACQASLPLLSPGVAQTQVRWAGDAIEPSHPLSLPSLPALRLSQHQCICVQGCAVSHVRVFSNELALHIRWPKYWSFSFSISPFNEYAVLISFRIDWIDLLQSKRLSRIFSSTTI